MFVIFPLVKISCWLLISSSVNSLEIPKEDPGVNVPRELRKRLSKHLQKVLSKDHFEGIGLYKI